MNEEKSMYVDGMVNPEAMGQVEGVMAMVVANGPDIPNPDDPGVDDPISPGQ